MTYDTLLTSSGVVSGESDLWCTYAAVRTLRWLGRVGDLPSPERVAGFLKSRQNSDGGYAWSAGMSSDAWATYYCTQALADLPAGSRGTVRRSSSAWVWSAAHPDGGFAMTPGQASDVWATYYAVRTLVEIYGERPPEALFDWLAALQAEDGGLAWSPAHAKGGTSDVRACYYAVTAWRTATGGKGPLPWDRERLTTWLRGRQSAAGGAKGMPSPAQTSWAWRMSSAAPRGTKSWGGAVRTAGRRKITARTVESAPIWYF